MRLFDTHAHVHFPAFADDRDAVMARVQELGIAMVTVGTTEHTNKEAVAFAERYANVFAAVGVHPSHVHPLTYHDDHELPENVSHEGILREDGSVSLESLMPYVAHPKVVAIGEFGLDYARLPEDPSQAQHIVQEQQLAAEEHLRLCTRVEKPAIIHCRDAHADMQRLLAQERNCGGLSRGAIIHCFTGTLAEAEAYIELGCMISFSGILTFAKSLHEPARRLPLTSLLVETDAPYLAPVPHRGKRNEPAYVDDTVRFLAQLRGISYEDMAAQTVANARKIFGLEM